MERALMPRPHIARRVVRREGAVVSPPDAEGAALPGTLSAVTPHSEVPEGAGLSIHVRVLLDGSSEPAQKAYAKAVQAYAEKLASESARQEASARAPGATTCEITESAVIRAAESLDRESAKRQRPANFGEAATLAGLPMFSAATGIMGGSYLHSVGQVAIFLALSAVTVLCVLYQLRRRLL